MRKLVFHTMILSSALVLSACNGSFSSMTFGNMGALQPMYQDGPNFGDETYQGGYTDNGSDLSYGYSSSTTPRPRARVAPRRVVTPPPQQAPQMAAPPPSSYGDY